MALKSTHNHKQTVKVNKGEVCGCYSVHISCSPTSTNYSKKAKLVLPWQVYIESIRKIELKVGPILIWLRLPKVCVC